MALKFTDTAIAAVLAASLAACGGSESSSSGGESPAAPVADAATDVAADVETAAADVEETAGDVVDVAADTTETAADTLDDAAGAVTEAAAGVVDDAAGVIEATADDAAELAEQVSGQAGDAVEAVEDAVTGGQTYEVKMLNADPNDRSQRMVFEPAILSVQPGDTVTWVPTDLTHLAASTRGMIPEGVEGWQGRVNQPVSYTFETPGIYGYNCTPHQAAGMVGLIVVEGEGKLDNLEAAKSVRHPGLATRRWDAIWADAEAQGFLDN
ncbi:MAG: pseudoazurin [Pseudomonadota bacterium]